MCIRDSGYTVVDAPTVITTHLTEIIKDNMPDLLNYAETQKLLNEMHRDYQKLVADVIPGQISLGGLQRILQNLLSERISAVSYTQLTHSARGLR